MQGMILADRYECLKRIGSGGMGDVYKAHDRRLDRIVAIKVLKSEYNEDDNFIRKFRRESLAAASISHPNIVSIYDVGMETIDEEDVYYIVMEYIDGKTLKELIREEGMLSQNQALNYLIQIAEALKIAHNKNIIHRDIKSQNIMVTRDNRVKVTDFGIARMAGNATVTVTNAVMGSVHYFSPEQARGQKVDARSDIYSMGIVLFEMLTGDIPFDSENPITVALMHVQNEIPTPSERNPRVSPEVDMVFKHMTEKKPSDRYDNVGLIIEDVKTILLGKVYHDRGREETHSTVVIPPKTRPADAHSRQTTAPVHRSNRPPNKKPKKKKSNPLAAIGGAALALLVILALLFGGSKIKNMLSLNESKESVEMIDLIGKDVSDAKDFAASNELKLNIDEKITDEDMEPGTVLSQSVEPGEVLKIGDQFSVVVAKEKEKVDVPDLANMTISEAQSILGALGLNLVVDQTKNSDQVPADRIISQDPKVNEQLDKGESVHVVMSKGEDTKMTVVPNLRGVTVEKAKALLEQQGLELGNVEEREDISMGPGEVIWQQYNSGNRIKLGQSVDIIVAKRPDRPQGQEEENGGGETEEEVSSKTLSYRVPDDGNTHQVEVVVQSDGSNDTVAQEEVSGGSSVSYMVQGKPGDKASILVDGGVVKSVSF